MRLLVDTQVLICVASGRPLGRAAEAAYREIDNELLWSAASHWEIAIKKSIGKLDLEFDDLDAQLLRHRIQWLPLNNPHFRTLITLAHPHRDPFDRLLVAQSLSENIGIISSDRAFDAYGVTRVW